VAEHAPDKEAVDWVGGQKGQEEKGWHVRASKSGICQRSWATATWQWAQRESFPGVQWPWARTVSEQAESEFGENVGEEEYLVPWEGEPEKGGEVEEVGGGDQGVGGWVVEGPVDVEAEVYAGVVGVALQSEQG
jgi:hypothetical protein